MLQAYATERAVASLGSECEIIDYYVNQDNTLFQRPTGLGSAAHDAHTALHYGPLKARYERFEAFSRENLNISGRRYQSLEELRQAELPYDVLLSGSDQIWNPKIFPDGRFDPVFFGAFSHKRKIAYAPSFGIPRIPDGMEEELRTYLESFSHLSVRERQGQGIVRDITGKDVPVVLDPTLLLEGGRGQGRRRGPGLYPLLLHQPPRRPGTLYPPPGGGDGAAGGAAVRRTPEGPPQGPLHSQRRSGGVSGSVPGCRLCVHQLLPRNGVLRPVPKALLYGGGTGRDGCAGEFPDLQPVEPPGTGGADHRQGRYRGPDGAHRLGGGGGAARPGAEVVPGLSALRPGGPAPYTGGGACQGRGTALAPFGGPHPLHRLHGLRQRLSQGRHHHGAGPGGLCLSGDRRSGLCAVRALHGGVPRPAGAASELHARCIRGLE